MLRLLGVGTDCANEVRTAMLERNKVPIPGAVRISTGVSTTESDIDVVCDALATLADDGPRWAYRWVEDAGGYCPDPETRELPAVLASRHRSLAF